MTERLLQFIWRFGFFNQGHLTTDRQEELVIISPGQHNFNQGPDFIDAKLRIGKITWSGSVELHLSTSDWKKHRHDEDGNYKNVVLHVVWEHDAPGNDLPVLELKSRVSRLLLKRYEEMMRSPSFIPCEKNICSIDHITWESWKERLVAERLSRKAAVVNDYLRQNRCHWEETFWWLLARNFGMKVNADAFESLARSLPLRLLSKQKGQIHQLEALLFGQGGLLQEQFNESYPRLLQREYRFLQLKHNLRPIHLPLHFLRMRPGNFPTVRLAQLAMLIRESNHLFSKIRESQSVSEVKGWFNITANDYWNEHYRFDEVSSYKRKTLGNAMTENILINTIVPVLFAYGTFYNEQGYKTRAVSWLEQIGSEKNSITTDFAKTGIIVNDAFDSQALIELKNEYCCKKRCLDCAVGCKLLKNLC